MIILLPLHAVPAKVHSLAVVFLLFLALNILDADALAFGNIFSRKARTSKKVHDVLVGRRTINNFEENLPKNWEDALEQAITAATYAPNHKRTEPWRFHLLGPKSIRKVCELNAALVTQKKGEKAGDKKLQRWLKMPGWLVVTCQKKEPDTNMLQPTSLAREDYAACCCAVQNLCLSLHAQGLGTKWTTGPVNFHPQFDAAIGLNSAEEYVVGTIWFGTPAMVPSSLPPKKLSLDDVLIRHN